MTLHEAIVKVLEHSKRSMSTSEIAIQLNINKWYQKKDGTPIAAFQIHGRSRNYPSLFIRNGSMVSLIEQKSNQSNIIETASKKLPTSILKSTNALADLDKDLMNLDFYRKAEIIDNLVPSESGIYCIRIQDIDTLPIPFNSFLKERQHNIIYIGIATQSLNTRFLNQELRANGHGTFFRSLGAVLGYRPRKGSLVGKANKKNYKFISYDERKIISWINSNLIVNWITYNGDFEKIETELIQKHLPLLNIAKNPMALRELKELRAECVKIANS